ncbi:hypothetical protein C0431_11270 [bacterium]|nr:hypothetical protein [bacterium]
MMRRRQIIIAFLVVIIVSALFWWHDFHIGRIERRYLEAIENSATRLSAASGISQEEKLELLHRTEVEFNESIFGLAQEFEKIQFRILPGYKLSRLKGLIKKELEFSTRRSQIYGNNKNYLSKEEIEMLHSIHGKTEDVRKSYFD